MTEGTKERLKRAALLGGQATAKILREASLTRYYASPNLCKQCGQVIKVAETERASQTRKRKFCSQSCADQYNNKKHPKRKKKDKVRTDLCERCKTDFIHECGRKRQYCNACLPIVRSEKARKVQQQRGYEYPKPLELMTKKELFDYLDGNPYKFKLKVTKHASVVFKRNNNGNPRQCHICGFHHIQISHKKAVAEFSDETTIREINSLKNLVGLCPNHHWMMDHGELSIL